MQLTNRCSTLELKGSWLRIAYRGPSALDTVFGLCGYFLVGLHYPVWLMYIQLFQHWLVVPIWSFYYFPILNIYIIRRAWAIAECHSPPSYLRILHYCIYSNTWVMYWKWCVLHLRLRVSTTLLITACFISIPILIWLGDDYYLKTPLTHWLLSLHRFHSTRGSRVNYEPFFFFFACISFLSFFSCVCWL